MFRICMCFEEAQQALTNILSTCEWINSITLFTNDPIKYFEYCAIDGEKVGRPKQNRKYDKAREWKTTKGNHYNNLYCIRWVIIKYSDVSFITQN